MIVLRGFLFLILFFAVEPSYSQGWLMVSAFTGEARDDGVCFYLDQNAYCGTGATSQITSHDFFSYDSSIDSWESIPSLPSHLGRQYSTAFSDGRLGYVFGGVNAQRNNFNDLWRFDPVAQKWDEMLPMPDAARNGMVSFRIDSTAYIISGRVDDQNLFEEVWAYQINSNEWISKRKINFAPRFKACAAANSSKGYLCLGRDPLSRYPKELYEYNPKLDEWSVISVFPGTGRAYAAMFAYETELYIMGGLDTAFNAINDLWKYDLKTGAWSQLDSLPAIARRGGMWWQEEKAFYYATGIDANRNRLKEVWKYTIKPTGNIDLVKPTIFISFNESEKEMKIKSSEENWNINGVWEMHDLTGKILDRGLISFLPHSIQIENIPTGLYVLSIRSKALNKTFKFVNL
ncbi:MAG: hypothetical protein IPH93_00845 [Saprospiraceae bacterium]|nr:hypothetical protein [Saprospiraceae bacterium]